MLTARLIIQRVGAFCTLCLIQPRARARIHSVRRLSKIIRRFRMAAEDTKGIARRMIDEVLNANNLAVLDEILAADYVDHTVPPGLPPNREGIRLLLQGLLAAFPDLHYEIEAELAAGDRIVQRLTGRGTQTGPLQGIPPTGKAATWSEIHIGRVVNGKIVEHWGEIDRLGMLQQLGIIPAPDGA